MIEYWSDYACPFCYIAAARMKRAMRELGIEDGCRLVFKAFRLNPNAKKVPRHTIVESFASNYGMTLEQARMQVDRISAMGISEGLDFRYATALNSNTFDALRLTKLAQSKGREFGDRFIDRFYRAYFTDNLVLADHGVLTRLSLEVGLTEDEVSEVLGGDLYAREVLDEENEAHMLGIRAVPFFVINGKYGISGAIDIRDMKEVLSKAYAEEEDMDVSECSGMVCGPDGCHPAKE
ncbi:MAG: DsbA family oxidoreductase [Candidatus Methanomethylophilaceae archaeon]|nr:DsbA family oxidoreductase [Candidatus Methanomethylophilaceae archaeon]